MNKISLIGFMGSGKSTIGRMLADKIDYDFVDTDKEIEKLYKPIPELFDEVGVEGFREIEHEILQMHLFDDTKKVISTGGGIITLSNNFMLLKMHTFMIHINTKPELIFERLQIDDNRHRIRRNLSLAHINRCLEERAHLHKQSNLIVSNDFGTEQTVDQIYGMIPK